MTASHKIATQGGSKSVTTHCRAGLWASHETTPEHITNKAQRTFSITFLPAGSSIRTGFRASDARRLVKHMHKHAGDAGGNTKFGGYPADGYDVMEAAIKKYEGGLR